MKLSAAFLARLISCVYQVSFCWCFFCSCSSCCKGDIPSDGDAAKSDPQMDCNPKPNTVINYFEISQGHINKEQMNNSTWLRSACIHIGGRSHSRVPTGLCPNEVKCPAFDMEIIFYSHVSETHFHKKGCELGLILKVRVFGTRKWRIESTLITTTLTTPQLNYV